MPLGNALSSTDDMSMFVDGKAEVTVRRKTVRFKEPNIMCSFVADGPGIYRHSA